MGVCWVPWWSTFVMLPVFLVLLALTAEGAKLPEAPSHPYIDVCPEEYGLQTYPHPDSCHSFYKCANGTLTEELCEHGLLYDGNGNVHNHCNYHYHVNCEGRYSEVVPHASGPCEYDYSQQRAGLCETYYIKCSAGVPKDVPCIDGLAYDNRTRSCNWPDLMLEFDCDPEQVVGFRCPDTVDPKSRTARFLPFPRFPAETCGSSYVVCVNSYPRRIFCGDFTVFDEDTLSCQDPRNVAACQ